jgi:hypothetical protein
MSQSVALDVCPCGKGLEISHADVFNQSYRLWCEACVPWSGHFNDCPAPCTRIITERRAMPPKQRPLRVQYDARVPIK